MNEQLQQLINMAIKKKETLAGSKLQYFIKAMLAGAYIGFGIMVSYRLGEYFYDTHSPATSLMSSLFFGIALVIIMYSGAELFTSNTMTLTVSSLKKVTTWKDTFENWTASYFGNLFGAVFFAVLILNTGLFGYAEKSQYLMSITEMKMTTPAMQLFFRAVLCNWLVCLAIWIPLHIKGDGAKVGVTMLIVFAFVVSGFEHSIANMAMFSIALFVPHPESINFLGAIHNLIPVTFGNIIGGAIFVGSINVYLSRVSKSEAPAIKKSQRVYNVS